MAGNRYAVAPADRRRRELSWTSESLEECYHGLLAATDREASLVLPRRHLSWVRFRNVRIRRLPR
jgi:hypothetical protein